MKGISMKLKIIVASIVLVAIGLLTLVMTSTMTMEKKIKSSMVEQFVNEDKQIAAQAEILLSNGASVEKLQSFVTGLIEKEESIAYAIVIDQTVTAIAHSDTEKIGKNYSDDTGYTVPACTKGEVMTSEFWADVQNAWTYDVMYPIYLNGELYGSMDVGIYNNTVDKVVSAVRTAQIVSALIMIVLIGVLLSILISWEMKDFTRLTKMFDVMGAGDFTLDMDARDLARKDELGILARSVQHMKDNLSQLITETNKDARNLASLEENLTKMIEDTRSKSKYIVSITDNALGHTTQQRELSVENAKKAADISQDVSGVSDNVAYISKAAHETATDAAAGAMKINEVVAQMQKIGDNVTQTRDQIHELERMSDEIEKVVQMIGDIASQTNLLSLNASIEAARAGEQGKGFAVVATEVGALAIQSSKSADDIAAMIRQIQENIQSCVTLMEEGYGSTQDGLQIAEDAKVSFVGITQKIAQISEEMENITSVVQKTSAGASALQSAIGMIEEIANDVCSSTSDISGAVYEQNDLMHKAYRLLKGIKDVTPGA